MERRTGVFDPERIIRTLAMHGVRFILIGGYTGVVHGSGVATFDLDICYDRSRPNVERLAAALHELAATLRDAPPDLPFRLDSHGPCSTATASRLTPIPGHSTASGRRLVRAAMQTWRPARWR
jgi:hypothetical protein